MRAAWLVSALTLAPALAGAGEAEIKNGRQIMETYRCNGSCHQSHSPDNEALSLYTRENRKVADRAQLSAMVERCVTRLELPLFPEDAADVAAALNHDHYHFP